MNPNERLEYYGFTIELNSTVAAGASGQFSTKIDSQAPFTAQSMSGALWTPATVLTSTLTTTNYPFDSSNSPGTSGNSLPTLNFFRIMITVNAVQWFANPIHANLLFGRDGGSPHYFLTQPEIRATSDIVVQIYNDAASTFGVQGQIFIEGYKTIRGG